METIQITSEARAAILYALRLRGEEMEGYLAMDKKLMDRPGIAYWSKRLDDNRQALAIMGGDAS